MQGNLFYGSGTALATPFKGQRVDYDALEGVASVATPVPGGVGSVTTSVLAKHLLRAAKSRR